MLTKEELPACPVATTVQMIGSKWKLLIMLHKGRVVLDISGEEKARLTVPQLLELFSRVSGEEYDNDRALLA